MQGYADHKFHLGRGVKGKIMQRHRDAEQKIITGETK